MQTKKDHKNKSNHYFILLIFSSKDNFKDFCFLTKKYSQLETILNRNLDINSFMIKPSANCNLFKNNLDIHLGKPL